MTNDKHFVIGDVHGCFDLLEELLTKWNPDNERLIFLGDYVDRGKDSLKVLTRVKELHDTYGAIALGGNHEDLFLAFLDSPDTEVHYLNRNGGFETISSFLPDGHGTPTLEMIQSYILETHADILTFVKAMPDYHETDTHIFVHAGVELRLTNWRESRRNDFRWIRDPFLYGWNSTGKTIVFGHTPTSYLNEDRSDEVWFSPCGTKIGIDGGAAFGGSLHGLFLDGTAHKIHSAKKENIE